MVQFGLYVCVNICAIFHIHTAQMDPIYSHCCSGPTCKHKCAIPNVEWHQLHAFWMTEGWGHSAPADYALYVYIWNLKESFIQWLARVQKDCIQGNSALRLPLLECIQSLHVNNKYQWHRCRVHTSNLYGHKRTYVFMSWNAVWTTFYAGSYWQNDAP